MSSPKFPNRGRHTAHGGIPAYRLGKLERHGVLRGDWLDLGCADGYWSVELSERGAATVVGVEPDAGVIGRANALPHPCTVRYVQAGGERLPFEDASFDGVLLNEVLEHVADERATLGEIARVLRPGGTLALFSPNRWFPFEGHGARWSDTRILLDNPVPLMPWLPKRLTSRVAAARNYWPHELAELVEGAGLRIVHQGWALAQFDVYPWLPTRVASWYRTHLPWIESMPAARFLAVSTFILAEPPHSPGA